MANDAFRSDLVDVAVVLHHETEKEVLVSETADRKTAVWLPKSAIEIEPDGHANLVTVTLPVRLEKEKGLI